MTDSPLKILIALQYYVPHRTGLTLHVQRIAEALAARGHEVTVLTARYDRGLKRDESVINGVRVIRLWSPIRISRGMIMPAYPYAAWQLVGMHDVVSIHTPMLETVLFGLFTKLRRKGLVITHHGDLVLPSGVINRFIEKMVFAFYKIAGRAAQRLIAYSNDYADNSYYIAPFRSKTNSVYPPIQIPEPNPQRVEEMRSEWLANVNGQARIIGFAGRFVEEKRPDVLIRALPIIHERFPGTKIVFAGQYDMRYERFYERNLPLVEEYRDHLIFLGLLEDPQELASFYAACDVIALPSDTECFALVQVEAMRSGTPMVTSNIPGAREVVRVTGMGELAEPGNSDSFGEKITRILENRITYVKTLAEIDRIFNFEETVDNYERHLRAAAEEAGSIPPSKP